MVRALRRITFLAAAIAAAAQQPPDPIEVLHNALPKLVEAIERLPRYTCVQTVNRSYYRHNRARPTCDETLDYKRSGYLPLEATATDRLRLDVAVDESGREIYSWAGAGSFEYKNIPEFVGGGPMSTGPFGPFLMGIFGNRDVHFFFEGRDTAATSLVWRFKVPVELSRYELLIGDTRRTIPFNGTFQISRDTSELERLSVVTTALQAGLGICEATTTVDFGRQTIAGTSYILPRESRFHAVGMGTETENVATWSSCREYRAESSIRFDDAASQAAGSADSDRRAALSPGQSMILALDSEIDTGIAAAGDPIVARTSTGDTVRGRIIRMEHQLVGTPAFRIALLFESIESDGVSRPLSLVLDSKAGRQSEFVVGAAEVPHSEESIGRTLVFPTAAARFVVPKGYQSRWVTVAPKTPR